MLERPGIPFFVTHDTAKAIVEGRDLEGDAVHVSVKATELTEHGLSSLSVITHAEEVNDKFMRYSFEGVPVFVHILKKGNRTTDTADLVMYAYETYRVPNPFKEYWESRNLIV